MKIFAKAKINLTLDIKGKRPDGYHEVSTVYQTIGLCDLLEIEKSAGPGIVLTCSDKMLPCGEGNLVYRAARLFFERTGVTGGVRIYLEKIIPYQAGLGGGSSDAAAALVLMDRLFGTELGTETLREMAAQLGSDTAFFIKGGAALASGRGEKLTSLPSLADIQQAAVRPNAVKTHPAGAEAAACGTVHLAIIKPPSASSTPEAYHALDDLGDHPHPDSDRMAQALKEGDAGKVIKVLGNSFEAVKETVCPQFDDIKSVLLRHGARAVILCGSGSAVCGFFAGREQASDACGEIKKTRAGHRAFLTVPV